MQDVIHVNCAQINIKGGVIIDFAKWWVESKMISFQVVNVVNLSCFIFTFVKKKNTQPSF
jgi:hypothetical protein